MEDWEEIQNEINSQKHTGYYNPKKGLAVGASEEIVITRCAKNTMTKYPIRDKNNNSLGYTWRFFLEDGRVWDVSNSNRKLILASLHPKDPKVAVPCKFKVTNVGTVIDKSPSIKVENMGSVADDTVEL